MIGVKRPLKLNAPRKKSIKKKKLLKQAPIPDPDDQAVVPIRQLRENVPDEEVDQHLQGFIQQQTSDLVLENPYAMDPSEFASCGFEALPSYEVMEEGDVPVKQTLDAACEFPETAPHDMAFRYKLLLEKANPKELIPNHPPFMSWLEDRYGHLVEKGFWYDRTVRLAHTYLTLPTFSGLPENDSLSVKDIARYDLEQSVGHLVPYTADEQEYLRLLENYKKSRVQIDGIPTLEYLRKYHSKPPTAADHARAEKAEQIPPSPEYLPNLADDEEDLVKEAMRIANRYVPSYVCPIHEDSVMKCLNPNEVYDALLFKCSTPDCAVFFTSDTHQEVRHQLTQSIHPTVYEGLLNTDLKCYCGYTPSMKLSQSEKNFSRVYLTCFKKQMPCSFFQWIHWKVRDPPQPSTSHWSGFPSEAQRQDYAVQRARHAMSNPYQTPKASQPLVATGLDRFKKYQVSVGGYLQKAKPWGQHAKPGGPKKGFQPSPFYTGNEFRNGLYVGNRERSEYGHTSPYFHGNQNTTACIPF